MKDLKDHSLLKNPQGWLTDKHIQAVNKLLHIQFPSQNGLQSPLILAKQLENLFRWYTLEISIGCVFQTGSLRTIKLKCIIVCHTTSMTLRKQGAAVIQTSAELITLEHIQVQRQIERSDCSLFAVAFATTLCYGNNPHDINYEQSKMRQHLITLL